jgi:hypothetical protein
MTLDRTNSARATHATLAWYGLMLRLPGDWNPVRLQGDSTRGSILLADLTAPQLAIRWQRLPRRAKPEAYCRKALQRETQSDENEKLDPGQPGWLGWVQHGESQDTWIGHSTTSRRIVQIIRPSTPESPAPIQSVIESLVVQPLDAPMRWSIFGFDCVVPAGFTLQSHRLNAGDLTLSLRRFRETLNLRQIGPASLALARQKPDIWLEQHARLWRNTHRARPPVEVIDDDTSTLRLTRRRRLSVAWWIARERVLLLHIDRAGNRIRLVDAQTTERARSMLSPGPKEARDAA